MSQPFALALDGISKWFGTTDALSNASLSVRPRTIHALLGENGAGKTTLMRVAFGLVQPDRGVIRGSDARPRRFATPADAIRAGIGMVHQHFTIVDAMTVAENVALGGSGRFDRREAARRVRDIASALGVTIDPEAPAASLGIPVRQQVEIIKALSRDARVLILDEPTAALAPAEVERLMSRLRVMADGGLSIVLITHKLREALAVADDVTVLRHGSTVLSAPASSLTESELATAMVGPGWAGDIARAEPTRTGAVPARVTEERRTTLVIRARGISVVDAHGVHRVRTADLDVHAGEIVGVAGVEGSGVRELLRAVAGRTPTSEGTLTTPSPVGFVPEDRHGEALALDFSLTENVALRGASTRKGLFRQRELRERTRSLLGAFDVRAPGSEVAARTLSGGNQQKLVLARELEGSPSLLVAENPTRGLDLRATAEIHARLRSARDAGMAIVVYSSDLDELLMLADRTFAMFAGTLMGTPRDREAIGRTILGAAVAP